MTVEYRTIAVFRLRQACAELWLKSVGAFCGLLVVTCLLGVHDYTIAAFMVGLAASAAAGVAIGSALVERHFTN
jgi:ribosomal protein S12 methylthiotransferase accessory factor YcaO